MHTIFVLNPKGGTGKTTIATNLAAFFTLRGQSVAIVDLDPQGSSMDWIRERPANRPVIHGVFGLSGWEELPKNLDIMILDGPPGVDGARLVDLFRLSQTVLIPVVPSPLDLRATEGFRFELERLGSENRQQVRIATVINRAQLRSQERLEAQDILRTMRLQDGTPLPPIGWLRASQSYVQAAREGLGIWELSPYTAAPDVALWRPLVDWLDNRMRTPEKQRTWLPAYFESAEDIAFAKGLADVLPLAG